MVHDVIAAITTSPFFISNVSSLIVILEGLLFGEIDSSSFWYEVFAFFKSILSCGLFGPAIDGKTFEISKSIFSEYIALLQSSLVNPTF